MSDPDCACASLQEAKVLLLLDSRHDGVRSGRSRIPGRSTFVNMSRFNRSLCLVNRLHSFFILPATVHFDFRESSFDLTKIRRR
jgi:hypothetical protein